MYNELLENLVILVLFGFVGFVVILKVFNMLYILLMLGINVIYGIVVFGVLVVFGEIEYLLFVL